MASPSTPSLTPYADRMEEAIAKMMADFETQKQNPGWMSVSIRINKATLPGMLRALAVELDMRTPPGDILESFTAAMANVIASLVGTLVVDEERGNAMQVALASIAANLAMRANPANLPDNSKATIDFDLPEEGTA